MRHVLTLIAAPGHVLDSTGAVTLLDSGRVHWLEKDKACDILLPEDKIHLPAMMHAVDFDYVLQPLETREKKLLIADMDSTMIRQECLDELADFVGKKKQVAAITERAMNGEIEFEQALRERVALLTGLDGSALEKVWKERITLMGGAKTLVATMKARGAITVLVSGGFTFFTSRVAAALGFDDNHGNVIEVVDGKLTGNVLEPILGKNAKLEALRHVAAQYKIPMSAALAVGDGANDLPMLQEAGLGVAYHAKPLVRAEAKAAIHFNDLTALLYAQGIRPHDWVKA